MSFERLWIFLLAASSQNWTGNLLSYLELDLVWILVFMSILLNSLKPPEMIVVSVWIRSSDLLDAMSWLLVYCWTGWTSHLFSSVYCWNWLQKKRLNTGIVDAKVVLPWRHGSHPKWRRNSHWRDVNVEVETHLSLCWRDTNVEVETQLSLKWRDADFMFFEDANLIFLVPRENLRELLSKVWY